MIALQYLVDALLTLYLYVLILRFVMQLSRADFRNQIAHAVLIVTNPVIMPLRKILPPIGKVDTASVVAILVVRGADRCGHAADPASACCSTRSPGCAGRC